MARLPVLDTYAQEAEISAGGELNVSISGNEYADLNIKLLSVNSTGAELYLTPISSVLGILPSKSIVQIPPATIGSVKGMKIILATTTTSTSTTTSTINQTAALLAAAISFANKDTSEGALMSAYNQLYIKDKVCNSGIYNETYLHYYGVMPSGPLSFENVSALTPVGINASAYLISNQLVYVNYSAIMRNGTKSEILSIELNMSPSAMLPIVKVAFEGLLYGDNYTIVNSTYTFQKSISNYCGAYVPKP